MKRTLILCLVLLMVFALILTGCNAKNETTGTDTAKSETTDMEKTGTEDKENEGGAAEPEKPATWIADRHIEGRIFLENDGAWLPEDQVNNPVAKVIKELTGISIEWKSTGATNGLEELTLSLATGDTNEVIANYLNDSSRQEASVLFKAAREGQFADLKPYLADTKIFSKYLDKDYLPRDTYENIVHREEFNGAVYIMHMNIGVPKDASEREFTSYYGAYVRKDIVDALGVNPSDIKSFDDLYNLAVQIDTGDFKDLNGNKVYAIGPRQWGGDIVATMYREFDWGNGTRFGVDTDGKVKHVTETHWAMDRVNAMRKLQNEGLLHPEYFTMENSRAEEGQLNGSWAIIASTHTGAMADIADFDYVPLAHLVNYAQEDVIYYNGARTGYCTWQVMADTENVDEIVKFADFLASYEGKLLWKYGIEGEHYDMVDGMPKAYAEVYNEQQQDAMAFKDIHGFNGGSGFWGWLLGSTDLDDITMFGEKVWAQDHNAKYQRELELIEIARPVKFKGFEGYGALGQLNEPEMADIAANLDPVLKEWKDVVVQAVLAKDEAAAQGILDDYLKRLEDAGLDTFVAHLQKLYDEDPGSVVFYNSDNY